MTVHDILSINAAGLEIFGRPWEDEARGFFLAPDGFKGWDGAPTVRREDVARSGSHGSFDARGTLDARLPVFTGICVSPSPAETLMLGERLTGLLADGGSGLISVQRHQREQHSVGRLAGATQFDVRGRTPRFADFQIQFWLPDPRKYGKRRVFTSAADGLWTSYHRGNFPAGSTVTVTGNAPSYTVGGPDGKRFKVSAELRPGEPHLINLSTGQITIRGQVKFGVVSVADTWTVIPNTLVAHAIVADGGGTAKAEHAVEDTYI